MSSIKFDYNLLKNALVEKDVENAYRTLFSKLFTNYQLNSPYGCDGYLVNEEIFEKKNISLKVLCEFKYNVDLTQKIEQIKILIQSIYYLKKFENDGKILPSVLFIGDIDECFIIHTNSLLKYLDYDLDWSIAPSSSYKVNSKLMGDMMEDDKINPHIFDLSDNFVWTAISRKIRNLSYDVSRLIKVKNDNIVNVFNDFCKNVLKNNPNLTEHDKATLFVIKLITGNKNMVLNPLKKNCLTTSDFGDVNVNEDKWMSFFNHYDGSQYSVREKEELVKIVDRIIEDDQRRRNGDFFTPTIWVDEAHKMISEQFGEDWKEKYVVWDCAWGTGNLTRDYQFKELYASTLHQSEIDVANSNRVNNEAIKFQYDFLNDGIVDGKIDVENDDKLPQGLKNAISEGKEIIILMNPPYAKATTRVDGDSTGVAKNNTNNMMLIDKMGIGSSTTYTQFLYKLYKLSGNINICVFSKPTFLSGTSFKNFRKKFLNKFQYVGGMLFQASEFDSVSTAWGINFTLWKQGETTDKNNFIHLLKRTNDFEIEIFGEKIMYNVDDLKPANKWCFIKSNNTIEYPNLKSGLNINIKKGNKMSTDFIGSMNNHSNNQMQQQVVYLTSGCVSGNGHKVINKNNFMNTVSLFIARKSIKCNWINDKDEYFAPNELHSVFQQFQYDSIVYSLFNTSSNQSSMRQIDYKDKKWDIKNEFFWMSKEKMMDLADQNGFDDLYHDAKFSNEKYVYNLLFGEKRIYDKLSDDAKEVLDEATSLVEKSFSYRKIIHESKPEYHLNTWDAGWYQIKIILKEYFATEYVGFIDKYKKLENRMRPLVYELGFLK